MMLNISSYPYLPSVCLLYDVSVYVFCPFFNQVACFLIVDFRSYLHIFSNSPLSDVSFINIFFQSVAYLLILLSFTEKFLVVVKFSLAIISSMDYVLNAISKTSSPNPIDLGFLLSSRNFIVLGHAFMSLYQVQFWI